MSKSISAFFISSVWLCVFSVHATTVLPVSLKTMSNQAEQIIVAKCLGNEVKLDDISSRVATFTTFEIITVVKGSGQTGETVTIKQIGGQLPGSTVRYQIHGIPEFTIGKEYIVFLSQKSRLGFSSPIGLSQGKFDVVNSMNGKSVSNGRNIQNLTSDLFSRANRRQNIPALLTRPGDLASIDGQPAQANLTDFLQTVNGYVQE